MNNGDPMDNFDRIFEGVRAIGIGGLGIAAISISAVKDSTSVLVGVVTIVCLLYTTFVKSEKRNKKP